MVIIMQRGASFSQVEAVVNRVQAEGFRAHPMVGAEWTVIGVIGPGAHDFLASFQTLEGVDRVVPISKPYKVVAREAQPTRTRVRVANVTFGGEQVVVVAGPCTVESEEQVLSTAQWVKECGAQMLRGGAFKPRTNPHTFLGHGEEGLRMLADARRQTGLPVVTEVLDTRDVEMVCQHADMLQIGARNMQNFALLTEAGRSMHPVLLKRGISCTVEELLLAAEYIAIEGNPNVVLCERGIRTFEVATRNTLDLAAVPLVHSLSHLPVIVDPSHAAGHWSLVEPLSLAAIACGADGIMVEAHPRPAQAEVDGPQSLNFPNFLKLMNNARRVAHSVGRML